MRRREERARQTKVEIQEESRRLSKQECAQRQDADLERTRETVERPRDGLAALLAPRSPTPGRRLGSANRGRAQARLSYA